MEEDINILVTGRRPYFVLQTEDNINNLVNGGWNLMWDTGCGTTPGNLVIQVLSKSSFISRIVEPQETNCCTKMERMGERLGGENYQFNFYIIVPTPQINTKNALFAPIRGLLAFDISNSVDKLF